MHSSSCLSLCTLLLWGQFGRNDGFISDEDIGIYTELYSSSSNSISSSTPAMEEEPPIPPSLIEYISSSLETPECETLFAMITIQDSSQKMQKFLNISSTKEYADYLKQAYDQLKQENDPSSPDTFNCSSSLKYWNEELVGSSKKERVDKQDFAETVLGVSLSEIGREDLEKLLDIRIEEIKHQNLESLRAEIESHAGWMRSINGTHLYPLHHIHLAVSNGTTGSSKSHGGLLGNLISFLVVVFFVGSCTFGCLLTVVTCYSDPSPKVDTRPGQSKYTRINPTEGSQDVEGQNQGKGTQGRITAGDLKRATTSESLPLLQTLTV